MVDYDSRAEHRLHPLYNLLHRRPRHLSQQLRFDLVSDYRGYRQHPVRFFRQLYEPPANRLRTPSGILNASPTPARSSLPSATISRTTPSTNSGLPSVV